MNPLESLRDQPVLVNPGRSVENPSVGQRGTIQVGPNGQVSIVLQYAVMFDRPAGTHVFQLTPDEVDRLLASREANGDFSITLERDIIPPPTTGRVVSSPPL